MKKVFLVRFLCSNNSQSVAHAHYCTTKRFKPISIPGLKHSETVIRKRQPLQRLRPRYHDLKGDEDWTNIWPAARSFNNNISLLPIRQGYIKNSRENGGVKPAKYANAELMKIPNFLHLTPVHIEKHCAALKKYCTKWPEELNDVTARHHFPLEFVRSDYIHSAPSIRDIRARNVTVKFELDRLQLDEREKYKFLSLLGKQRHTKECNTVTITADRCPSHRQNYDYLIYVLTALITESKKFENWELESGESDWLKYKWDQSRFRDNVESYMEKAKINRDTFDNYEEVENKLKTSVEAIYDDNESSELWNEYKDGVVELMQLKKHDRVALGN